jgi:hypothetical protein
MNELHFAYKVRQHLNHGLHELPRERLAPGRCEERALAQQKVSEHQSVLADGWQLRTASGRQPAPQAGIRWPLSSLLGITSYTYW